MALHYQILLPLLSLFLVRVDLTDLYPIRLRVELLKVYDGDTVLIGHGTYRWKLRLAKIDSPEKGQPFLGRGLDAGKMARMCLERILNSDHEYMAQIGQHDMYGRILGDLNQVSLRLIKEGCTSLYPYAEFSSRKEKFDYLKSLQKAKASRRGLWQFGGYVQPKKWRKTSRPGAGRR